MTALTPDPSVERD